MFNSPRTSQWRCLREEVTLEFRRLSPTPWDLISRIHDGVANASIAWSDDGEYLLVTDATFESGVTNYFKLVREGNKENRRFGKSCKRNLAKIERKFCQQCGTTIDHGGRQNIRKFCDLACQQRWWRLDSIIKRGEAKEVVKWPNRRRNN